MSSRTHRFDLIFSWCPFSKYLRISLFKNQMACEIFEQFDCSNVLQIIWILNYLFILLSEQNTADVYLQQMTAKGCLTPVLCFFPSFVDCRIINLSVLCLPLIFFYRICFSPLIFIFLSTSTSQLSPVLHVLSHSAHFVPAFIYPVVLCCALLCPALFCCVKFPSVLSCSALPLQKVCMQYHIFQ